MTAESMTMERRKIGELDCAIVDSPGCAERIAAVVVLCHGFGAPGEDLVPCAPELFGSSEGGLRNVRFVFPSAPIQMDPTGFYDSRAWWPIDMEKLQSLMDNGQVRDLREDHPDLLDERNRQLTGLIQEVAKETSLGLDKFVLGGFSQGAMLATEVALSIPALIGGLVVWSGTLLNEKVWREYAANKKGLRVVQTHGRIDPILPFVGAELLKEIFDEFEIDAEFVDFQGQHTIPREAIEMASALIQEVSS